LLYLGDDGLVVSQIFVLFALPFYFTAVFAVARRFAGGTPVGIWQAARANFKDPLAILPLIAITVGLTLGLSGVDLPHAFQVPRKILVFAAVILYSLSFGMTARFRPMLRRVREYVAILPVKFLVGPLTGLAVALLLGYTPANNALGFKIIVIQSAMPVAIWSVVATKLFRLDEQLALGLWIFTTLCVAGLVPAIAWVAQL
jgi:predicted permease